MSVNDGDTLFRHALAMSLTVTALSPAPTYIFPATAADRGAEKLNSGRIPEGALMMLPADYDTANIKDARLRKVADTLKVYGAYVVDRNDGTPFVIYVENGTNLGLHKPVWNNSVVRELDRMRAALRQVVSVDSWLDGNDKPMQIEQRLNLLSMRGPWRVSKGDGPAELPLIRGSRRSSFLRAATRSSRSTFAAIRCTPSLGRGRDRGRPTGYR